MRARRPFVAANWKMHKTGREARDFIAAFLKGLPESPGRVVICPAFTALHAVHEGLRGTDIALGAQDLHWEAEGALTGEVSADQLKEAGCTFVIVGHSERRRLFGETDETVNRKLKAALAAGLTPILCVGETLTEREEERTEQVLWGQLTHGLTGLDPGDLGAIVMAYEPVWAIGTGKNAAPEQAQEAHAFIRAFLRKREGGVDAVVPLLYGGSVKAINTAALMRGPDVDGALVGGASLDPADFAAIVRAAAEGVP